MHIIFIVSTEINRDLGGNSLASLPNSIGNLKSLTVFYLLDWLLFLLTASAFYVILYIFLTFTILSDNELTSVPVTISNLNGLSAL